MRCPHAVPARANATIAISLMRHGSDEPEVW